MLKAPSSKTPCLNPSQPAVLLLYHISHAFGFVVIIVSLFSHALHSKTLYTLVTSSARVNYTDCMISCVIITNIHNETH